jgi:hypothetical protein
MVAARFYMNHKKQTATQAASETSQSEGPGSHKDSDFGGEDLKVPRSWTRDMEDTLVQTLVREIHMGKQAQSGFKSESVSYIYKIVLTTWYLKVSASLSTRLWTIMR